MPAVGIKVLKNRLSEYVRLAGPVLTLTGVTVDSTLHFLSQRLDSVSLATYDHRMAEAARALGFALHPM